MAEYTNRRKPYTAIGISRLDCVRCGKRARFQWQVCADGNYFRPLCASCDVALNRLVLRWMGHPKTKQLMERYETYVNG